MRAMGLRNDDEPHQRDRPDFELRPTSAKCGWRCRRHRAGRSRGCRRFGNFHAVSRTIRSQAWTSIPPPSAARVVTSRARRVPPALAATRTSSTSSNSSGSLYLIASAMQELGGGFQRRNGGAGGNASSTATGSNTASGSVTVTAGASAEPVAPRAAPAMAATAEGNRDRDLGNFHGRFGICHCQPI